MRARACKAIISSGQYINPRRVRFDSYEDLEKTPTAAFYQQYTGRFGVFRCPGSEIPEMVKNNPVPLDLRELPVDAKVYIVTDWLTGCSSCYFFQNPGDCYILFYVNGKFGINSLNNKYSMAVSLASHVMLTYFAKEGKSEYVHWIKRGPLQSVDVMYNDVPSKLFMLP